MHITYYNNVFKEHRRTKLKFLCQQREQLKSTLCFLNACDSSPLDFSASLTNCAGSEVFTLRLSVCAQQRKGDGEKRERWDWLRERDTKTLNQMINRQSKWSPSSKRRLQSSWHVKPKHVFVRWFTSFSLYHSLLTFWVMHILGFFHGCSHKMAANVSCFPSDSVYMKWSLMTVMQYCLCLSVFYSPYS